MRLDKFPRLAIEMTEKTLSFSTKKLPEVEKKSQHSGGKRYWKGS